MAQRPIFVSSINGPSLVRTYEIDFHWFPGMAKIQAQRSIDSLHEATRQRLNVDKILEISTKSKDSLGEKLSAFNLMIKTKKYGQEFCVECAYQSSKVFERGGPFKDLLHKSPFEAKKDERLRNHGRLIKYRFFGVDWSLEPKTAFYDWLYLNALENHPDLSSDLLKYHAFSDIAFNPERSINCQAYSAALYVSLFERGLLTGAVIKDKDAYLDVIKGIQREIPAQATQEKLSLG